MTKAKRIAKNTSILFIATVIGYILGLFTTLYTARYLGAEGFGIISLALSLTAIFGILTDLGLNTLTVREVARDKNLASKFVVNTIFMKVLFSIITFLLIILTTFILGYPSEVSNIIYVISFSMIFTAFTGIFYSIFQSYQKMEYQSIGTIINAVLMFIGVIIAVFYSLDIIAFAFIYFIVTLIILIYSIMIYSWKFKLPRLNIDFNFWKPTVKEALPFAITGIFTMIYFWIDTVILSIIVGNEVVGWYSAAFRLIFVFATFYSLYMVVIFPVLSEMYKTSPEYIKIAYEHSFKYMLILNIPIAVVTTILADKIILIIYGSSYTPTIIALQIMIWAIIFMFINNISLYLLGSVNKQNVVAKIIILGAIFNIVFNLLLIPQFSYIGSSVVTVITEIIMLPLFIYILHKTEYVNLGSLIKDLPRILISNLVLLIVIYYLSNLNLLLTLIIGTLIYLVMIYITKSLDDNDIKLFRSLLK